jgi:hypothetical protein
MCGPRRGGEVGASTARSCKEGSLERGGRSAVCADRALCDAPPSPARQERARPLCCARRPERTAAGHGEAAHGLAAPDGGPQTVRGVRAWHLVIVAAGGARVQEARARSQRGTSCRTAEVSTMLLNSCAEHCACRAPWLPPACRTCSALAAEDLRFTPAQTAHLRAPGAARAKAERRLTHGSSPRRAVRVESSPPLPAPRSAAPQPAPPSLASTSRGRHVHTPPRASSIDVRHRAVGVARSARAPKHCDNRPETHAAYAARRPSTRARPRFPLTQHVRRARASGGGRAARGRRPE